MEPALEYALSVTDTVLSSIPWVLPIVVAIGLYILHRIFKQTKIKIVEIKKNSFEKQNTPQYDLTTAHEYRIQYKELAQDQLMQDIRHGLAAKSMFGNWVDLGVDYSWIG